MSRTSKLLIACFLITLSGCLNAQDPHNLSFEQVDTNRHPTGWQIQHNADFQIQVDSTVHQQGKYSLEIQKISTKSAFGAFSTTLPAVKGTGTIKLVGYLKTQDVTNGFAGLWMRLQDKNGTVTSFNNMAEQGVKGTADWKEYSIEFPYNEKRTAKIVIGGLLTCDGKAWIDNLHVFLDGKPFDQLPIIVINKKDSASAAAHLQQASDALNAYSPAKLDQLVDLCQIWGFLKYYHPAVSQRDYDWDSTLIGLLPRMIKADPATAYQIEEQLIDSLGPITPCADCINDPDPNIKISADYGILFAANRLPGSLQRKLAFIRDNHQPDTANNYVQLTINGGTEIQNEPGYGEDIYPSEAVRLITIFRYWNIIHYYYPYRYLIKEDWNTVLPELIPRFLKAADKKEYFDACLELIGHIHDTHANVVARTTDSLKGMYILPFQAKFIEGQLVVTNYYTDSPGIRSQLQIGDIIQKIDGSPVDSLVRKYLPLTPASNEPTQYRNLSASSGWLLRSNTIPAALTILHSGNKQQLIVQRIPISQANISPDWSEISQRPAWQLLQRNIGYINPAKLKETDFDSVRNTLQNTRAIIIDLRCYPGTFMPFTYGAWFKHDPTPFARFTVNSRRTPGAFTLMAPVSNGGAAYLKAGTPPISTYNGKLIIIVNSTTQSQAEYTTLAFQSVPGALVIGSTTAGADGNVTRLNLPGGITTMYSGLGVYYPDNSETQRVGVRIDVPVHATIKGIREGRDEYLEKALALLKQ